MPPPVIDSAWVLTATLSYRVDMTYLVGPLCKSRSNNPSVKRPISLAAPEQICGS
jgi:hypothetical protein